MADVEKELADYKKALYMVLSYWYGVKQEEDTKYASWWDIHDYVNYLTETYEPEIWKEIKGDEQA